MVQLSAKTYLIAGITLALITAILIPISIFVPVYIQSKFSEAINYNVLITERASKDPDHQVYKAWQDSTSKAGTATSLHAFMYNITNAAAVLHGEKPHLVETGPYIYTIVKKKDEITFDEDLYGEKIVRYVEFKTYVFNREATPSHLSPADTYTNVNLIFQLWRSLVRASPLFFPESKLLERYGPQQQYDQTVFDDFQRQFVTKSVDEWLFGWNDVRFDADKSYNNQFPGLIGPNRTDASQASPGHAMYTGESRPGTAFTYYQHNGNFTFATDALNQPLWKDFFASRFVGTDGTRFHPGFDTKAPLSVYVDEARRSLPMVHRGRKENVEGLELLTFEIAPHALENATTNPTNALWNMDTTGIFNLSGFKMMPMIITKPHFLNCDDMLTTRVTGLSPNVDTHDTRLGVHQISGIVMTATKSLQVAINTWGPLKINTLSETWFEDMASNTYTPIAWFSEKGHIREKDAKTLAAKISSVETWVNLLTIGSTIICILFLILSFIALIMAYRVKLETITFFQPSTGSYADYDTINAPF